MSPQSSSVLLLLSPAQYAFSFSKKLCFPVSTSVPTSYFAKKINHQREFLPILTSKSVHIILCSPSHLRKNFDYPILCHHLFPPSMIISVRIHAVLTSKVRKPTSISPLYFPFSQPPQSFVPIMSLKEYLSKRLIIYMLPNLIDQPIILLGFLAVFLKHFLQFASTTVWADCCFAGLSYSTQLDFGIPRA